MNPHDSTRPPRVSQQGAPPAVPREPQGDGPRRGGQVRPVRVGRRWLPWHSRTRELTSSAWDLVPTWGTSFGDDPISAVIGLVLFVVAIPFMIPALLVTPFFLVESLLQWICMPFTVLARAFGWMDVEVDVHEKEPGSMFYGHEIHREKVNGWGRATERMRQLEAMAAQGIRPSDPRAAGGQSPADPYTQLGGPVLPGMQQPIRR